MGDSARAFYDELASHYHLMFESWDASMARQAAALGPLLERECGAGARVLDCACGIGTQALGLAGRGFRITGSDISTAAVERAGREAASRGLQMRFAVADMKDLSSVEEDGFDAVIAMDNALPHLESGPELLAAAVSIHAKLRPGGLFAANIRDYDQLILDRPTVQGPVFLSDDGRRRIVFQIWDWIDQRRYRFHLYITREADAGWEDWHHSGSYRAILRAELAEVLSRAGFQGVRWIMPADSAFHLPVVVGFKSCCE